MEGASNTKIPRHSYSMPLLNWKGMILALPAFAAHADDRRAGSHLKRLLNW
jgi:hypothetical protein